MLLYGTQSLFGTNCRLLRASLRCDEHLLALYKPWLDHVHKRATSVAHFTNFSFQFFLVFTQDASQRFLYHCALSPYRKKVKNDQKSNQRVLPKNWLNFHTFSPVSGCRPMIDALFLLQTGFATQDMKTEYFFCAPSFCCSARLLVE